MLQPKRMKHRRQFRGTWRRVATKGAELNFGSFGIKTMDAGWITDRQIEACRVILSRSTRKVGRFWIRIFPDKPYSKKPPEVTMGGGKGDVKGGGGEGADKIGAEMHRVGACSPTRQLGLLGAWMPVVVSSRLFGHRAAHRGGHRPGDR